jgi:hypothetical protein
LQATTSKHRLRRIALYYLSDSNAYECLGEARADAREVRGNCDVVLKCAIVFSWGDEEPNKDGHDVSNCIVWIRQGH